MFRAVLVAAVAVAVTSLVPAAEASFECRHPWVEMETGLYHPLTRDPITYCSPTWPAP